MARADRWPNCHVARGSHRRTRSRSFRPRVRLCDMHATSRHARRYMSESAWNAGVGALQAAGIAVSAVDDVAGLAVMRTVAMLANEAADAVTQGIATAQDVDLAMQKGVNYPLGPLAWADRIGAARVRQVVMNLRAHYGEDRYRVSPLITRRCASGRPLAE